MSPRSVHDRLNDIVVAVEAIRAYEHRLDNAGIGRDDPIRLDAVIRQLALIGEAASHLTEDLKGQEPDVPWSDVVGMRIILDHRYHLVDPNEIWGTVDNDLEPLRQAVKRIRSARFTDGFEDVDADHARLAQAATATAAAQWPTHPTPGIVHTCGAGTADGGRCQRTVSGPGVRCHHHRSVAR